MKCQICKNESFKIVKKKHTIKTRFAKGNEITLENLPVYECRICGDVLIPETSEKYIELVRNSIMEKAKSDLEKTLKDRKKPEPKLSSSESYTSESEEDEFEIKDESHQKIFENGQINFAKIKETIKKIIG